MIGSNELTPEAQEACSKIEKLLRLAADKSNPHVAANALAKAEEWMREYNLSQAAVEQNSGDKGKRLEQKVRAGHRKWQQELWGDVAKLNFCLHFVVSERQVTWKTVPTPTGFKRVINKERFVPYHRIVGRVVNVRAAQVMAEYLDQAIERLTIDECNERDIDYYSTWANSFREGMAERICEKVYEERERIRDQERADALKREREARQKERDGVVMTTALTLSTYMKSEEEANKDFLDPDRHRKEAERQARIAEDRAKAAEAAARREAEWNRWCKENPEEARRIEEEYQKEREAQRKREEKNARRRASYVSTGRWSYREPAAKGDPRARRMGYEAGEKISIHRQAEGGKSAGALG